MTTGPKLDAFDADKVPILQIVSFLRVLTVATIALSGLASAAPAIEIAPDVTSFTLDNGLTAVVIPDHRAPVVTHMIWYKAGSAEDPPGKSGIAHFLEHLMFKGTKNHPPGDFRNVIAEIGGNENAFTSFDYTAYYQTVAREHLGRMMEFEADRMANVVIDEAAIATEREVIIEERHSRVDNDPSSLLSEAANAALYQNSPYGRPIIGWAHEMATLERLDAVAFYDRYYTPNNAVLVVAGDVTEAEVRRLAEATYGKLSRRADPPPRIRPREPPPLAARTVVLADPQVTFRLCAAPIWCLPTTRLHPAKPKRSTFLVKFSAEARQAGSIERWSCDEAVAATSGAGYSGNAIDDSGFSHLRGAARRRYP